MSNEKNHKPVEDMMYWWLSQSRPFYIGDEYRIDLVHSNRYGHTVKIVVTNLKNMPDEYPHDYPNKDKKSKSKIDRSELENLEILIKAGL